LTASANGSDRLHCKRILVDVRLLLPRAEIRGVPVTLREYLTLMEAMQADIAGAGSRTSTICRAQRW